MEVGLFSSEAKLIQIAYREIAFESRTKSFDATKVESVVAKAADNVFVLFRWFVRWRLNRVASKALKAYDFKVLYDKVIDATGQKVRSVATQFFSPASQQYLDKWTKAVKEELGQDSLDASHLYELSEDKGLGTDHVRTLMDSWEHKNP